jgi:hypothetical protein
MKLAYRDPETWFLLEVVLMKIDGLAEKFPIFTDTY